MVAAFFEAAALSAVEAAFELAAWEFEFDACELGVSLEAAEACAVPFSGVVAAVVWALVLEVVSSDDGDTPPRLRNQVIGHACGGVGRRGACDIVVRDCADKGQNAHAEQNGQHDSGRTRFALLFHLQPPLSSRQSCKANPKGTQNATRVIPRQIHRHSCRRQPAVIVVRP